MNIYICFTVAPTQPICKVVGTAEYGHNISLTCVSEEGSPTPTYKWERYNVKNVPQAFPLKTTESKFCLSFSGLSNYICFHSSLTLFCVTEEGVLSLVNVSMETSGFYICLSSNKVGSAKCNMTLSVTPCEYCHNCLLSFVLRWSFILVILPVILPCIDSKDLDIIA